MPESEITCDCCHRPLSAFNNDIEQEGDIIFNPYVTLEEDLTFAFGLNGLYQLMSNDKTYKEGDVICWTCLETMEYTSHLGVECDYCHNKFQSIYSDQGWGCASDVIDDRNDPTKKYIYCGYGSRYDDSKIELLEDPLNSKKTEPIICDDCIDVLKSEGKCRFDENKMVLLGVQNNT